MRKAQKENTVKIHYTGKLDNGLVFDSSIDKDPLEFTIGAGSLIEGFETGVVGMNVGEKKTLVIPPEKGYGERNEELALEVDKNQLPSDISLTAGETLQLKQPDGNSVVVIITKVTDDTVTLDANHPLAGKTLTFDIELMEILEASA
jgi:FKBP-type peptidyl-prolyl cis-trans isomerase 2